MADLCKRQPADDLAQIRDLKPAPALARIAERQHPFVSRDDDGGTHQRELRLWEQAGGRPEWDAYIESGQGMGPTLIMADQKRAYTLADMGTYLNFRDNIDLVSLSRRSDSLRNPYAAMTVNPDKHPRINAQLANAFVDFLISHEAQQLIASYHIDGHQLFRATRLDDAR